MNPLYYILFLLLMVLNNGIRTQFVLPPTNFDQYDPYGSLLAVNEYLAILAQNDEEHFTIITNPFTNHWNKCILPYNMIDHRLSSSTRFVYSVAIGIKQNASQLFFSYIDENFRRDVFLTTVFLEPTSTGCVQATSRTTLNMTDLGMQEHSLVVMDPYGRRAYAIGISYIACIEIEAGFKWQQDTVQFIDDPNDMENLFFPKASVITEDHYIFVVGQRFTNFQFLPYLFVLNTTLSSNISLISATQLSDFNFGPSSTDMSRYSTMSISVHDHIEQFIIGIPALDMLLFLSRNNKNLTEQPVILRKFISSSKGVSFGKSVALLNDRTFAVLAHALPTLPWSTSQVQVYSLDKTQPDDRPLVIYPNNQQIIPSLNSIPSPHSILTIVSWRSHLGFVFDAGTAFILSVSPPGHYSTQVNDSFSGMSVSIRVPCIPGTARNSTNFGPCFLCPPNTKNNGSSGIECEPCVADDASLCLRGSLAEIRLANVTGYNQAVPYPNSPDLVDFDDVLLHNLFSFMVNSPYCLFISPLFWLSIAAVLGLVILLIMAILTRFPQRKSQRKCLKTLFTHIDLVGEGELWFGGILTMAIIVLFAFTCYFSTSFASLYPIATFSSLDEPCPSTMPNIKFSTGLQLLSIPQHEEQERMFGMLDEQDITLSVYFVGTAFLCHAITMQQNFDRGQQVLYNQFNCSFDAQTGIAVVSTLLPQHVITMQFDLTGPHFIGGLRICLDGPGAVKDDDRYTLKELQFCRLFYTENETLTVNPTVDIKMTKVINRTLGYIASEDMSFSGLWVPTLTASTLSDQLQFRASGEYRRYLSDRVTLVVAITESEFFLRNTEEPIARNSEIALRTILFVVVSLELFSFVFLLIKLMVRPVIRRCRRCSFSHKDPVMKTNNTAV